MLECIWSVCREGTPFCTPFCTPQCTPKCAPEHGAEQSRVCSHFSQSFTSLFWWALESSGHCTSPRSSWSSGRWHPWRWRGCRQQWCLRRQHQMLQSGWFSSLIQAGIKPLEFRKLRFLEIPLFGILGFGANPVESVTLHPPPRGSTPPSECLGSLWSPYFQINSGITWPKSGFYHLYPYARHKSRDILRTLFVHISEMGS